MTILLTASATLVGLLLLILVGGIRKITRTKRKWRKKIDSRPEGHRAFLGNIPKAEGKEKAELPNIVVILMDDLGWGDISRFGSKAIHTPNIDAMADAGAVLHNGYSSSPVCTPSRFGLLTGRYPHRGIINGVFFPSVKATKSDAFDMGYENDGVLNPKKKGKKGLAAWRITSIIRKTQAVQGILSDEITIPEALKARGYRTGMFGKWHLGDRSPHLPNDKGFDYFFGAHYSNDMVPYRLWRNREPASSGLVDQSKLTSLLTEEIETYIDDCGDDPFFVYYPSPWPHHPLNAGKEFQGSSQGGLYGDCIQEIDWSLGRILKKLEETGKKENTLIIFTSDNGPWHQGSPGFHRGRKGNSFDGGQVVPTIACWPGTIPPGRETDEHVMNIDFMPTILKMAGVSLPEDREIDGRDIMPLLRGETEESPHEELYYVHDMAARGLRTRDHFKYFASCASENATYKAMKIHPFLFNLKVDPNESYDQRKHFPEKAEVLRKKLASFNREMEKNPRGWR